MLYRVIPEIGRSVLGGCFDPIGETKTLNDRCLADRHCANLTNAFCDANYDGNGDADLGAAAREGRCRCEPGFEPAERDPASGLVGGCRAALSGERPATLETCQESFVLEERKVR